MYDAASPSDLAALQRACGELDVELKSVNGATMLHRLRQAGCLKARLPRPAAAGWADIVTLNTSGGVAAGDRLDSFLTLLPGTQATIASQAAERHYRALPGSAAARLRTRLAIADGAAAEWLPQETILFDGCALDRSLDIDLAEGGRFLGVETLVFGRAAMGERVRRAVLRDRIRLRRGGRLILHDAIRIDGDADSVLARPAVAAGARTVATVLCAAPDAEAAVDDVRAALADTPAEHGVSAWNGMLLVRLLAPHAAVLRGAVAAALDVLRGGRPLPRVWLC